MMEHNTVDRLMDIHDSVWEELMDAKHYLHERAHAEKAEAKSTYLGLASDELGHAKKLIHEGDALVGNGESGHLEQVWKHLRSRLIEEHTKLEAALKS